MDVVKAIKDYVASVISSTSGLKVLLLDEDTATTVSMAHAWSMSELHQMEVYGVDRLDRVDLTSRATMAEVKCIVFCRPTKPSVSALVKELKEPKHRHYNIFFTNVLDPDHLAALAAADVHGVVKEVQEVFADFAAVDPHLFSLYTTGCIGDKLHRWRPRALQRSVDGVTAVLRALKKEPLIRYQASSDLCEELARKISYTVDNSAAPETRPLLLILDRRDDAVTPVLQQWTYQAMAHELLGIEHNRVQCTDGGEAVDGAGRAARRGAAPPKSTFYAASDDFLQEHMYSTWNSVLDGHARLAKRYKQMKAMQESFVRASLEDIRRFIANYSSFKSIQTSAMTHTLVVTEVNRLIQKRRLLPVDDGPAIFSEQAEFLYSSSHSANWKRLRKLIPDQGLDLEDRMRMVILYLLRHGTAAKTAELVDELAGARFPPEWRQLVPKMCRYSGKGNPGCDSDAFKAANTQLFKTDEELEVREMQHTPLLSQTLDRLQKGKLTEKQFPCVEGHTDRGQYREVIVFFVGGVTYEEAKTVAFFNQLNQDTRVIVGGTTLHNFASFREEINQSIP